MTTSEKIKYFRLIHKMTQKDLGLKSGIAERTIQKYELGERNPKPEQLQKIAQAMSIPTNSLLDDDILRSEFTSIADVLFTLFILNNKTKLDFVGERNKEGKLRADTISIKFNNDYLNELLSNWELVKSASEEKESKYGQLAKEFFESEVKQIDYETIEKAENILALDEIKSYEEKIKLWLISRGDISLEDTNDE